jgi:multisubunit Na+/H+ antiporter MnhG subunit
MGKRAILILAGIIGLFAIYDFWRGYHETRSVAVGIVAVAVGLAGWAYYWRLPWLASFTKARNIP